MNTEKSISILILIYLTYTQVKLPQKKCMDLLVKLLRSRCFSEIPLVDFSLVQQEVVWPGWIKSMLYPELNCVCILSFRFVAIKGLSFPIIVLAFLPDTTW